MEGVFRAELPPLGFASFELRLSLNHVERPRVLRSMQVYHGEDLVVESQIYKVYFDPKTGAMKMITNKLAGLSGRSDKLTQRFMEYSSSTGDKVDKQPSGNFTFTLLYRTHLTRAITYDINLITQFSHDHYVGKYSVLLS